MQQKVSNVLVVFFRHKLVFMKKSLCQKFLNHLTRMKCKVRTLGGREILSDFSAFMLWLLFVEWSGKFKVFMLCFFGNCYAFSNIIPDLNKFEIGYVFVGRLLLSKYLNMAIDIALLNCNFTFSLTFWHETVSSGAKENCFFRIIEDVGLKFAYLTL